MVNRVGVLILCLIFVALAFWGVVKFVPRAMTVVTTRLLTLEEIQALPIGTKVWVEYNRERFGLLPDSAMERQVIEGIGDVIRTPEGYWELSNKLDFGVTYRVWEKMPSKGESQAVPWNQSPWE